MVMADTDLLTIEDVANRLRVSVRTVRNLIADGKIVTVRVGRQIRITEEAYQEYLKQHTK